MPFTGTYPIAGYEFPDDAVLGKQRVFDEIAGATVSLHLFMYGFADIDLALALVAAQARGVQVEMILDHTEATTPSELVIFHRMMQEGFPQANVCITTSPKKAIMHRKGVLVNALGDESARKVWITGSTNWSKQAFEKQDNDLIVIESAEVVALQLESFNALFAWGLANEPAYQTTFVQPSAPPPQVIPPVVA